ncbi:MAG: hypothetical protein K0U41_03610 [Gammaproteobacteria bacterium]|nr:hypothetical protein [Gammaproteobacteria bacterium]
MSNRIRVNGNGGDHGLMHNAWYDALIDINVPESQAKAVAKLYAKNMLDNMEISKNFDLLNQKVDNLDEKFSAKFAAVDQRFDKLEADIDKRFETVDKRFDKLESYIDKSISNLKIESRWLFGIFFAVLSGMSALLIEILSKLN